VIYILDSLILSKPPRGEFVKMLYATGVTPRCRKPKPHDQTQNQEPGPRARSQEPGAERVPGQQQPRSSSCCQEAKRLKACHTVRKKAKIFWKNAKKA